MSKNKTKIINTEVDTLDSVKENKMGTMPVNKLLISMSLPIIISMLVQALYNIVDSIFVAQINENALTAVSLAYPVQNLMIAIASGTGVGVNSWTCSGRMWVSRIYSASSTASFNPFPGCPHIK